MAKIQVLNKEIAIYSHSEVDYICITDIARYKDEERSDYLIQNWLRNRNTIEFLGIWEQLNNPSFNSIEFDGIKKLKIEGSEGKDAERTDDLIRNWLRNHSTVEFLGIGRA